MNHWDPFTITRLLRAFAVGLVGYFATKAAIILGIILGMLISEVLIALGVHV